MMKRALIAINKKRAFKTGPTDGVRNAAIQLGSLRSMPDATRRTSLPTNTSLNPVDAFEYLGMGL